MSSNKNYHLKDNWEEKYRVSCQKIQWIQTAEETFSKIKQLLPSDKDAEILQLGCGTSTLSQILKHNGYNKITCVDFSKRLIKARTSKNSSQPLFICADFAEPFKFEPQTQYDVIIDKGSIDCIFCDQDSLRKVLTCVSNCYNRLNNGGKLISISLGLPKTRKYWFRNKLVPFELQVVKHMNTLKESMRKNVKGYEKTKQENSEDYFMYICTKNTESQENNDEDQINMENVDFNQEEPGSQHPDEPQNEDDSNEQQGKNEAENQGDQDKNNQKEDESNNQQEQNEPENDQYGDQFDQNDQGDQN